MKVCPLPVAGDFVAKECKKVSSWSRCPPLVGANSWKSYFEAQRQVFLDRSASDLRWSIRRRSRRLSPPVSASSSTLMHYTPPRLLQIGWAKLQNVPKAASKLRHPSIYFLTADAQIVNQGAFSVDAQVLLLNFDFDELPLGLRACKK